MIALLVAVVSAQLVPADLKVYRGKDGQRVEVVTLAGGEKGRPATLVRVTGSGSERDGLVFRGITQQANRDAFVMRYGGKEWTLFDKRDGELSVFMPGPREFRAKFDEKATKEADAKAVVKTHEAQLADDSIALAEKAEWPHLVAKYEKAANEAASQVSKSCGAPVTLGFRWASFDDDTMANVDAWKLCAPVVSALQARCAAVKARPKVVCALGASPSVERAEGVLRIVVPKTGASTGWLQQELSK